VEAVEACAGGGEEHRRKENEGHRARLPPRGRVQSERPRRHHHREPRGLPAVILATTREGGGGGGQRWRGEAPPESPKEGATRGPPQKTDPILHLRPNNIVPSIGTVQEIGPFFFS
jgi:hypothetical protein